MIPVTANVPLHNLLSLQCPAIEEVDSAIARKGTQRVITKTNMAELRSMKS